MWQNTIVYIIGALVLAYSCYKLYVAITRKGGAASGSCSSCEGCSGCDLKAELTQKKSAKTAGKKKK